MLVYVAHAVTESADHYTFVFTKEPTHDEVVERVYNMELAESLEWYMETTSVTITPTEVLEN
jgi:hypothetical protein